MRKPIRICHRGLGNMGAGMARLMLQKSGLEVVAAIGRPRHTGKDLGEILGLDKELSSLQPLA